MRIIGKDRASTNAINSSLPAYHMLTNLNDVLSIHNALNGNKAKMLREWHSLPRMSFLYAHDLTLPLMQRKREWKR